MLHVTNRIELRLLVLFGILCLASFSFAERVNLAKYQSVSVDSTYDNYAGVYATDGIVSNKHRWVSDSSGPHWLKVTFPFALEFGSAHLFLGKDDGYTIANFSLQYHNGSSWVDIPGAVVSDNTVTELNLIFTEPVTTDKVRLYTSDNNARVKELALYPPNGGTGYPIGTDVVLNLALNHRAWSSSTNSSNYPIRAVDGFIHENSRWLSNNSSDTHKLSIDLKHSSKIGSAHLYSGYGTDTDSAVSDFVLKYWDGNVWQDIPGTSVSGNTQQALRIDFTSPVTTDQVRLQVTEDGYARVRELMIFPANHGVGYPLGTNAVYAKRNYDKNFKDYGDDFYTLDCKISGLSLESDAAGSLLAEKTKERKQQYQVLYQVGTDYYRFSNRDTGKCLEVADASKAVGAAVREADFNGLPHQLWKLWWGGSHFEIKNVWSGHFLAVDGDGTAAGQGIVQQADNNADTQRWSIHHVTHYPKKGIGGYQGTAKTYHYGWAYEWSRGTGQNFTVDTNFAPMQWSGGWPNMGTLPQKLSPWQTRDKQAFLLGFNEPDKSDQANMSTTKCLDLWPQLMQMNVPLVSPAWANPWGGQTNFMNKRGYRCEYAAIHWYGAPSADGFMNNLASLNSTFGKPLWITEFSNVDWSGTGSWTYADCYDFFAEILWRMENTNYIKRYAVFPFSGAASGKRSNFFTSGSLSPIGRIYTAWDGDTTIRDNAPYYFFNKYNERHMKNGGDSPEKGKITEYNAPVQWYFHPLGDSLYYLVSTADNGRLSFDGSVVTVAAADATGADVEWKRVSASKGWFYLQHPATNKRLNMSSDSQTHTMVDKSKTADSLKWRFIKPLKRASAENYYIVHKSTGRKLRLGTSRDVELVVPSSEEDDVKWNIVQKPYSNWLHLDNIAGPANNERLHAKESQDFTVNLAESLYEDGNLQWQLIDAGSGWVRLKHNSSGKWLHSHDALTVNLVETANTGDNTRWRLVDTNACYLVHKASGNKLHFTGANEVDLTNVSQTGDDVVWFKRETASGKVYFDNSAAPETAERLHAKQSEGFNVNLVDSKWKDGNLKWQLVDAGDGWYYLDHESSGDRLCSKDGLNVNLTATSETGDDVRWRLINPVDPVPSAPTGVTAIAGDGQIIIDWDENAESDLLGYNVYRAVSGSGPFVLVAESLTVNEYIDTAFDQGETYYYMVTAIDYAGSESPNSNLASTEVVPGRIQIHNWQLLNRTRVGRTSFEYEIGLTLANATGEALSNIEFTIDILPEHIIVSDNQIAVPSIPANGSCQCEDTIRIVVDLTKPMERMDAVCWIAFDVDGAARYLKTFVGEITFFADSVVYMPENASGLTELMYMMDAWLTNNPAADIAPAPDGDGIVNLLDFAALAEVWTGGVGNN